MRTLLIIVTASLGVVLAQSTPQSPLPEQSFVAATGQRFYLDLDTAEGNYSEWRHEDLSSLSAMRATIRFPRVGKDPKWAPTFSLWLQKTEAGRTRNSVGLQLFAPSRKPPLSVRVVQLEDGKVVSTENLRRAIDLNENLVVEMAWETPHIVAIRIGETEVHKVSIPWSIDSVAVGASTGELKVDPLVMGNLGK